MRIVVTAAEMAEMDRYSIEVLGIPGIVLMENAGLDCVVAAEDLLGDPKGKRVVFFCGKGNNGGDGYVVARHLHNHGAQVEVYLVGEKAQVRGDARTNLHILEQMGIGVRPIATGEHLLGIPKGAHLVVDALLGTGVQGPVTGLLADVIEFINRYGAPVLSIDLPTGMNTDVGSIDGPCVRATVTVTMGELKRGLLFSPGREHAGRVRVADISMPPLVRERVSVETFLVERNDVAQRLPKRPPDAHKTQCGKVFILAGSLGMTGAAALTSESTLRAGTGLVYLGIPRSLNDILEEKVTEVITKPLPETPEGSLSLEAETPIAEFVDWADVVALGPGLTTHPQTKLLVEHIVSKIEKPMVLDADGINALARKAGAVKQCRAPMVLTPHPGEVSRLVGLPIEAICANPIEVARQIAADLGKVLVLKGGPTVIAEPDGRVYINPTGNAGMATAGAGDVLTGAIAGLMAQGLSPRDAAIVGVYVHGLAGDLAAQAKGRLGMIAGDILAHLPAAFQSFENP